MQSHPQGWQCILCDPFSRCLSPRVGNNLQPSSSGCPRAQAVVWKTISHREQTGNSSKMADSISGARKEQELSWSVAQWWSTCLACMKPRVPYPAQRKRKEEKEVNKNSLNSWLFPQGWRQCSDVKRTWKVTSSTFPCPRWGSVSFSRIIITVDLNPSNM